LRWLGWLRDGPTLTYPPKAEFPRNEILQAFLRHKAVPGLVYPYAPGYTNCVTALALAKCGTIVAVNAVSVGHLFS
jgi:hypothetical protein